MNQSRLRIRKTRSSGQSTGEARSKAVHGSNAGLVPQSIAWLELPAEIRLMIYREAVLDQPDHPIRLDKRKEIAGQSTSRGKIDCFGLTQTCRQIRHEFRPMYYQHTHFAVIKDDVRPFCAELAKDGIHLSNITYLIEETANKYGRRGASLRDGRTFARDFLPILESHFKHGAECRTHVGLWDKDSKAITTLDIGSQKVFDLLLTGNEIFKQAIKNGHISQILVTQSLGDSSTARFVYKTPHDEPWMRKMLGAHSEAVKHVHALGIAGNVPFNLPDFMKVSFGVHY